MKTHSQQPSPAKALTLGAIAAAAIFAGSANAQDLGYNGGYSLFAGEPAAASVQNRGIYLGIIYKSSSCPSVDVGDVSLQGLTPDSYYMPNRDALAGVELSLGANSTFTAKLRFIDKVVTLKGKFDNNGFWSKPTGSDGQYYMLQLVEDGNGYFHIVASINNELIYNPYSPKYAEGLLGRQLYGTQNPAAIAGNYNLAMLTGLLGNEKNYSAEFIETATYYPYMGKIGPVPAGNPYFAIKVNRDGTTKHLGRTGNGRVVSASSRVVNGLGLYDKVLPYFQVIGTLNSARGAEGIFGTTYIDETQQCSDMRGTAFYQRDGGTQAPFKAWGNDIGSRWFTTQIDELQGITYETSSNKGILRILGDVDVDYGTSEQLFDFDPIKWKFAGSGDVPHPFNLPFDSFTIHNGNVRKATGHVDGSWVQSQQDVGPSASPKIKLTLDGVILWKPGIVIGSAYNRELTYGFTMEPACE